MISLSVIIPIYNVEHFLCQCINSVVDQSFTDLEIILVDDGSTDTSPQICDEWASKDSRIKVIHKQNEGLGYARNSGLELATGEYVTFLDSDDYIDNTCYEDMLSVVRKENADCIKYGHVLNFKGKDLDRINRNGVFRVVDNKKDLQELSYLIFENFPTKIELPLRINASCCWGIFKMKIIEEHNLLFPSERELLSEDYVFHFNYIQNCTKIILHENTYYHYRVNLQSLSRKIDYTRLNRAQRFCEFMENRFREENYVAEANEHLLGYFTEVLVTTTKTLINTSLIDKVDLLTNMCSLQYSEKVLLYFDKNRLNFRDRFIFNTLQKKNYKMLRLWPLVNLFYRIVNKLSNISI